MHIEFTEGEDKITLEGPTKDVQMVQGQIEVIVTDLVSDGETWNYVFAIKRGSMCKVVQKVVCVKGRCRIEQSTVGRSVRSSDFHLRSSTFPSKVNRMDFTEISVDPKFHRHLIGKGGVNSEYCRCQNSQLDAYVNTYS